MKNNIAFKCNYCDGGSDQNGMGFAGICSNVNMHDNIFTGKRIWCSQPACSCYKFLTRQIDRQELIKDYENGSLCDESGMLLNWHASAGPRPNVIRGARADILTILTTRFPDHSEDDRVIFGAFIVDTFSEGDGNKAGFVQNTSGKYRIALTEEESEMLPFWKYQASKSGPGSPNWGSGLFRYFDNAMGLQILKDILEVKRGTKDEAAAQELLEHYKTGI